MSDTLWAGLRPSQGVAICITMRLVHSAGQWEINEEAAICSCLMILQSPDGGSLALLEKAKLEDGPYKSNELPVALGACVAVVLS